MMDEHQFAILIMCILLLGLMVINFFRFNVFFSLAAIGVSIGMTLLPGLNAYMRDAAYLIAAGEALAMVVKIIWGKNGKNKNRRYTG